MSTEPPKNILKFQHLTSPYPPSTPIPPAFQLFIRDLRAKGTQASTPGLQGSLEVASKPKDGKKYGSIEIELCNHHFWTWNHNF